ncbi:MAG: MFS transporter [Alphaproteobacteria bacterium]
MAARGAAGEDRRALFAWCVYDWANSAFPTVILTFVFAAYFARGVAETPVQGTALWGWTLTASGIAMALLGPILGAVADQGGRRKPWLALCTLGCVLATAALWFTKPDPSWALWAMIFVGLANLAFECGTVFYNALLPGLAPRERLGRWSGWGWGLGYAGGMSCLVVALFGLVQADPAPFGLDKAAAEPVRAVALLAAAWFAVFSLPLFLRVPDAPGRKTGTVAAVRDGLRALARTLRALPRRRDVGRYLLARMIYTDGLNTLFAFGGLYAAGTFGMDVAEVIQFGIALNVTAGLGAGLFAWVDDWIGAKRTVMIALAALTVIGAALLLVESKAVFWGLGIALGAFFGPAQAASRSLMARLAPPGHEAEMFGIYALSGKATAFIGPALLGWTTLQFDSQRAGMATVLVFFVVGMALLAGVPEPAREKT